jgi:hypothetical protein
MKPNFGPTLKAIDDTITDIKDWLDQNMPKGPFKDMDGSPMDIPLSPEEEYAIFRLEQLTELQHLREPISPGWQEAMHFGYCCHPEQFGSNEDPMGDLMGRNY